MKTCQSCGAQYEGALERCPLDRGRLVETGDPLVGRLLRGAYRVLAPIGVGRLATVYRGRHEGLGREVAVKVLSRAYGTSPVLRERFLREARAANRIRHPHVVDVFDVGETDDGVAFLVAELLDGRSLAAEIADGPLPPPRALRIAAQAAAALGAGHALGIVHRDVKPANVIVRSGPAGVPFAKLLDFGLANVRGEVRLTASGELFGTPAYMAPEQAEGAPAAPPVDVYALGCTLFEMLTGELPFTGAPTAVLDQHLRAPPSAPSSRRSGLPEEVDALVLGLLTKDPARRPDARAAERSLWALLSGTGAPREPGLSGARAGSWAEVAGFAEALLSTLSLRAELDRCGLERRTEMEHALRGRLDQLLAAVPALASALEARRGELG